LQRRRRSAEHEARPHGAAAPAPTLSGGGARCRTPDSGEKKARAQRERVSYAACARKPARAPPAPHRRLRLKASPPAGARACVACRRRRLSAAARVGSKCSSCGAPRQRQREHRQTMRARLALSSRLPARAPARGAPAITPSEGVGDVLDRLARPQRVRSSRRQTATLLRRARPSAGPGPCRRARRSCASSQLLPRHVDLPTTAKAGAPALSAVKLRFAPQPTSITSRQRLLRAPPSRRDLAQSTSKHDAARAAQVGPLRPRRQLLAQAFVVSLREGHLAGQSRDATIAGRLE